MSVPPVNNATPPTSQSSTANPNCGDREAISVATETLQRPQTPAIKHRSLDGRVQPPGNNKNPNHSFRETIET